MKALLTQADNLLRRYSEGIQVSRYLGTSEDCTEIPVRTGSLISLSISLSPPHFPFLANTLADEVLRSKPFTFHNLLNWTFTAFVGLSTENKNVLHRNKIYTRKQLPLAVLLQQEEGSISNKQKACNRKYINKLPTQHQYDCLTYLEQPNQPNVLLVLVCKECCPPRYLSLIANNTDTYV